MKLFHGLGLKGSETLAFVGAGGKTSALFALAGELKKPVLLTTTTHLGIWQTKDADEHIIITSEKDLATIDRQVDKTFLLTGPVDKNDRLKGLDFSILEKVYRLCKTMGMPLLIEADGARLRNMKAPADYEPAIPPWVDVVIVMAGLNSLGKPLDKITVHRPEIFSALSGLNVGEIICEQHLEGVLRSSAGGLKGIPEGTKKILFLNQVENELKAAKAFWLAKRLEDVYDRVLIGSLAVPDQNGPIFSAHSQVAGIILAAGGSERLGQPKQLLSWEEEPFVVHVAKATLDAGLSPVIVVTGSDHELIELALAGLPVSCVYNPRWVEGQSTSLRVGIEALPKNCDRAMFLLSDQPQISPLLIRQLVEQHNKNRMEITAPMTRERRGNPVLFGRETFEFLKAISGDQGGRAAFRAFKVNDLPWVDNRLLLDVDTPDDVKILNRSFYLNING